MPRALCTITLLLVLHPITSCVDPEEEDCHDCGPCGFVGGPNPTNVIFVDGVGVDDTGAPAVALLLAKAGQCASDGADNFWLRPGDGSFTLEPRGERGGLDTSLVNYNGSDDNGSLYRWRGRDLTMTFQRTETELVRFTFIDAGAATTIGCVAGEATIDCALE
ncbi:hypothetical protein [Sorangium sp. So ce388]|uniref:hypothetical protein n=1 Tax=Sorangium sp. So ce388 TaxID=3133309 RepID=UPI003F5BE90B